MKTKIGRLIKKVQRELNNPKKLMKYTDLYVPIRDDDNGQIKQSRRKTPETS